DLGGIGLRGSLRPGRTALLRAGPRGLLGADALLEGLVAGIAEALVIAVLRCLGRGLLTPAAAPRTPGGLGLGRLLVDLRIPAARAQAERDALLVLLLAVADHHVVHPAHP